LTVDLVGTSAAGIDREARDAAGDRALSWAGTLFVLAVIVHNGDHLRRGADKLTADVFWLGTVGILVEVALVILIFQRHRLAPLAAVVTGLSLAAGYVEVHFLPGHGLLSDSFTSAAHVSPLSWFAASMEIVAALILVVVGARVVRARGGAPAVFAAASREPGFHLAGVHPIASIMVLSQTATLAISFFQAYG